MCEQERLLPLKFGPLLKVFIFRIRLDLYFD